MDRTSYTKSWSPEKRFADVPCQNCGKLVKVLVPFVGCVFCADCGEADSGHSDGTEDFYERRRLG